MKFRPILWIIALVLISCDKDKFTTVPQLEAKSISPETVSQGDIIRFVSKFTDKEGDLDSVLIVYKWYSGAAVTRVFDTMRESIAAHNIPLNTKDGEIILRYAYNFSGPPPSLSPVPTNRDTMATLGILVKDKDSNRSNYVESAKIRLKDQ